MSGRGCRLQPPEEAAFRFAAERRAVPKSIKFCYTYSSKAIQPRRRLRRGWIARAVEAQSGIENDKIEI
jgi:hypothetical protein